MMMNMHTKFPWFDIGKQYLNRVLNDFQLPLTESFWCSFQTSFAKKQVISLVFLGLFMSLGFIQTSHAERIKDLSGIQGVRQNQLIGYGLVVGLDGSGDQTTQTPFTVQSIISMMQQLGVSMPAATSLQLKNVAAVMVTSSLPAFAQPGQTVDVTVSSIGNAKSLRGGTLLMTPLKGADNQIYAMAQGNVLVGGVGASANGAKVQVNHLSVGRISSGQLLSVL